MTVVANYTDFFAGRFIRETGSGKDIDYTTAWRQYRFRPAPGPDAFLRAITVLMLASDGVRVLPLLHLAVERPSSDFQ